MVNFPARIDAIFAAGALTLQAASAITHFRGGYALQYRFYEKSVQTRGICISEWFIFNRKSAWKTPSFFFIPRRLVMPWGPPRSLKTKLKNMLGPWGPCGTRKIWPYNQQIKNMSRIGPEKSEHNKNNEKQTCEILSAPTELNDFLYINP